MKMMKRLFNSLIGFLVEKYHECPDRHYPVTVVADGASPVNMVPEDKCEVVWTCKIEYGKDATGEYIFIHDLKDGEFVLSAVITQGEEHQIEHKVNVNVSKESYVR